MKLRLVFTSLGPLTLSLFFAAYSPLAHAADVTVFGTPGTPGVDSGFPTNGGPGGAATAVAGPNSDPSKLLRTRQAEPAVKEVAVLFSTLASVVKEEMAAVPSRPPPRARPMLLAMVSPPLPPQAAQAAQAA
jgi:hypothetical protein